MATAAETRSLLNKEVGEMLLTTCLETQGEGQGHNGARTHAAEATEPEKVYKTEHTAWTWEHPSSLALSISRSRAL